MDEFRKRYLKPRGLPDSIVLSFEYGYDRCVVNLSGLEIEYVMAGGDCKPLCYPPRFYEPRRDETNELDTLMDMLAELHHRNTQANKNLREENAALVAQVAKLQRKIEKLQLTPGGKEYLAAKTHFETSRDKK